jgi:hypothetical protein
VLVFGLWCTWDVGVLLTANGVRFSQPTTMSTEGKSDGIITHHGMIQNLEHPPGAKLLLWVEFKSLK